MNSLWKGILLSKQNLGLLMVLFQNETGANYAKIKKISQVSLGKLITKFCNWMGACYNEVLTISNVYNNLASNKLSFRETDLHQEMGGSTSMLVNGKSSKLMEFIKESGNTFLVLCVIKRHRFLTGQIVNEEN